MKLKRCSVVVSASICLTAAIAVGDNRTMDGSDNNAANPQWGSTDTWLGREASGDHYVDGMSMPTGASRPSARVVSNAVAAQSASTLNSRFLSDFVWQWGQFLDHDLDLTPEAEPHQPFDIPVPAGDPFFDDPMNPGTQTIGLNRSVYDPATGVSDPRQQINQISTWIDGSNVYGSDTTRAAALRTMTGGKLKVTTHATGDLLPFNLGGLPNAGGTGSNLFLAGDVRANEQVGLTAMHTLFVREHNRLADEIAAANSGWSDEQVYQHARKIVGGQMQAITFNEFLPALLGPDAPSANSPGYVSNVDPAVSNAFATAAYRIGHTMLSGTLWRLDDSGNPIANGNLALRDAFFEPTRITGEGGIDPLLRGLAAQQMQEIDNLLVDDVRNFLFGPPGSGGLDLASLNIQRGRDHGLADYNSMRADFGLTSITSFSQITSDTALASALQALYGNVDDIDAWVGGLAEDHLPGSSVGELFTAVMVNQFVRLRDCDWYWYERDPDLSLTEIDMIHDTTLTDVILRNTNITQLQANVFFVPEPGVMSLIGAMGICLLSRRHRR